MAVTLVTILVAALLAAVLADAARGFALYRASLRRVARRVAGCVGVGEAGARVYNSRVAWVIISVAAGWAACRVISDVAPPART